MPRWGGGGTALPISKLHHVPRAGIPNPDWNAEERGLGHGPFPCQEGILLASFQLDGVPWESQRGPKRRGSHRVRRAKGACVPSPSSGLELCGPAPGSGSPPSTQAESAHCRALAGAHGDLELWSGVSQNCNFAN